MFFPPSCSPSLRGQTLSPPLSLTPSLRGQTLFPSLRRDTPFAPLAALCLASALSASAQPLELRLADAVRQAVDRYGAVQVTQAQLDEAAARLRLARTAYLPRVDAIAQLNRATRNNVFGLLIPQGLPSVSGPPLEQNSTQNVWGSSVGFLVAWEPFDFGLRQANVNVARAAQRHAAASLVRTRHDLAALVADSFLTVLAAEQTLAQAEASVRRAEVFERSVEALVNAKLRPGADLSRARAESAAARNQRIHARQAIDAAKALLAAFLHADPTTLTLLPERLAASPPQTLPSTLELSAHPAAHQQDAAIDEATARTQAAQKAWAPRFQLLASVYARGTGARSTGETLGGLNGIGPNIHNWAVGVGVTFPLAGRSALHAERDLQAARLRAETARRQQLLADLSAQCNAALAALAAARDIAANMPDLLEAARATERQVLARYRAGLATTLEVADAHRHLAHSEVDSAVARLGVWRALLGVARAQGDIDSFLKEVSQ